MSSIFMQHLRRAIEEQGLDYDEWLENYVKETRKEPKQTEEFTLPEPKESINAFLKRFSKKQGISEKEAKELILEVILNPQSNQPQRDKTIPYDLEKTKTLQGFCEKHKLPLKETKELFKELKIEW